tara:strand:- start:386 stop:487 length:102 start_codon:yes stop_codon:yes gene_type:complete
MDIIHLVEVVLVDSVLHLEQHLVVVVLLKALLI